MRIAMGVAVLIGMLVSVGMCAARRPAGPSLAECQAKGEAYFRSTGTTVMDTGASVAQTVYERCSREPLAFGS